MDNNFKIGTLYFIKNEFFDLVSDKYLKLNKEDTFRPHYYALKDIHTDLFWVIPCSRKIDKYEKIIQSKKDKNKPHNHTQILKESFK